MIETFAIKEAVYKALAPYGQSELSFLDVSTDLGGGRKLGVVFSHVDVTLPSAYARKARVSALVARLGTHVLALAATSDSSARTIV